MPVNSATETGFTRSPPPECRCRRSCWTRREASGLLRLGAVYSPEILSLGKKRVSLAPETRVTREPRSHWDVSRGPAPRRGPSRHRSRGGACVPGASRLTSRICGPQSTPPGLLGPARAIPANRPARLAPSWHEGSALGTAETRASGGVPAPATRPGSQPRPRPFGLRSEPGTFAHPGLQAAQGRAERTKAKMDDDAQGRKEGRCAPQGSLPERTPR